ncbi:Nif3-like dinuclear metal center hexameric protein [Pediococcus pentosaceus]|uniref:GTP cyclohydrolase 1 type 2 homolog n=1 Tax=Pediococcus pentosaceus TaxID=1255 RepID=A0A6L5A8E9_PEDPE|nr:Nif3-like dinuclear metal center hexameric protein [Pediococcus pentosaceus]KAF0349318.1 Nif3-like dinuclear metal center hexameric protein [Pediococcus pentosaceus]KAF0415191.1 Nif3-like dinuclear metal center hexameric protein [Pediococcus pentosaceus]KAF0501749.1 Nif3-like dinuclear metal center hexameric protein [Pediococcus pentosaceus]MBF7105423.1 Nif3-like dinuclear metal center hexameric protein [Pediococcus pentosaceus]MBF7126340.1 Nif3-like dinuclear metal center hexameric protein
MLAKKLIDRFESFAPKTIAFTNDPVGLQIGNVNNDIKRVMVTLDVRPEVVDEAIKQNCDMIFSHHPLIFRPIKNLDLSNPQNQMYAKLIQNSILVYSAHTNLDVAKGGMNDWLTEAMGLNHVQTVYSIHYDTNIGRIGVLSTPVTVEKFAKTLKKTFNLDGLRLVTSDNEAMVKNVAVVGGDGGKFYPEMLKAGADVFVTGDVYYHTGHDMLADGINVVDVGHNVEKICIPKLASLFNEWKANNDWKVEIIESTVNTNPYQFI